MRKTTRLYAHEEMDGTTRVTAIRSLANALTRLENNARSQGREVLFDTLEISIDRSTVDERTMADIFAQTNQTYVSVAVNAECVLVSETPTAPTEE